MRLDAHAGIEGEAPAVIPYAHGLRVLPLEQTTPGQRTQETDADRGLYLAQRFGAAGVGKAVGEDAAFEVAAEFSFDMGRR